MKLDKLSIIGIGLAIIGAISIILAILIFAGVIETSQFLGFGLVGIGVIMVGLGTGVIDRG